MVKKGRRRRRTRRKMNIKEKKTWSYSHTLISGSERLKWTSPAQHVYCYGVYLSLCVSSPSFSVFISLSLCCQSNQNRQRSFCSVFSSPLLLPKFPFLPSVSLCHVFPYFGMSMCYLLTLCMNDNMSVYSYRESYPIPLVLTKKWFECCTDSGFLFIFYSVQLLFFSCT